MVIEFRCPNGHRLSCPDERAGLHGKCPKCQAAFQVPLPDGQEPAASDSAVSEPELSETDPVAESSLPDYTADSNPAEAAPAAEPATAAAPAADERIVFLCPKGHRLNCPASMQGRPGKCPHCGATFLVPQYEAENAEGQSSESLSDEGESDHSPAEPEAEQEPVEEEIVNYNGDAYQERPFEFDFTSLTSETVGSHAMAVLFQRLWPHKQTGGVVELYLKGGEVIAPEWFSSRQSQEACGMFAFAERDGSFTVTAVNWDAIERIAVRRIGALPQGMFDE